MILSIILFFIVFLCVRTFIMECKKKQVAQAIITFIYAAVITAISIINLL
ncbi:hypothetical protein SAMN05421663_1139 [Terribacillus halophilus]|uniref:Uncharacterized protein n=1 Tax=Terribacillus halophilus TaxID=361279 RepID=A0A1G6VL89_9BACI|nr:hypothetical protein [Terribacillus halophilus]SDD53616.1 hypothetical protein SAMN05421663_1139 [Terribacillus halophilus]